MIPSPAVLRRSAVRLLLLAAALPFTVLACDHAGDLMGPGDAPAGLSRAYSSWAPKSTDTCTTEIHDRYAVVGSDGKLYPTWHPPVDPETGCTFGHEHGRDPRGSDLFDDLGMVPFGLANEAIDFFAPHEGFKIEWENNVEMQAEGGVGGLFRIECDVMFELHQGTDGSGRFVQPKHEMGYFIACTDGSKAYFQIVTTIGHEGEYVRSCDGTHVTAKEVTGGLRGGGQRVIPDITCLERELLVPEGQRSNFGVLRESWQFSQSLRTSANQTLVSIGPYFNVFNPSRVFDPSAPNLLANVVDLCFADRADGRKARGNLCDQTAAGATWDHPGSAFDGAHRDVDINGVHVRNAGGPEVWYTDGFGRNGSPTPFPGSIRQIVASVDNGALSPRGPSIGRNRPYSGHGVHAPN
ncbi:MAG: hypothetical protein R3E98_02740 [Gemmatimonadota bacterium]